MMEAMRSMASGWIAKVLMGLLVLSFAVWGIADILTCFGRGAVATVGDTEIDARDFQSELTLETQALSNRLQRPRMTLAESAAFGLPNVVLERMIDDATLNDLGRQYNLGLSDPELAKSIAQIPAFQIAGRFDRNQMNLALRNLGTTEDRYVVLHKNEVIRAQLAQGLAGQATIPTAAIKLFNAFSDQTRNIDYVTLSEDSLGEIAAPSDSDLKSYFESKKLNFRAPEYRTIQVLKLEPGDILDPTSVTDEDAKIYFETVANRFVTEEKRQVQQILFPTKEEAQAAKKKMDEGASFDDIVTERNLKNEDIDFGLLTKNEVTDPAAGEAVFALKEGEVSDIVEGRFGHLILRAAKIEPRKASDFEEVKDQLKAEIATNRAGDEVLDMFGAVEDELGGGATLEEIAKKLNLPLRTVTAIAKDGSLQTGDPITDLPAQDKLLASAFETDIDYEADPVDISNNGYAWFRVTDIIPSRDRALDEVRDDVLAAWKVDEKAKRTATRASDLLKRLKDGQSLTDLASAEDLAVSAVSATKRQGNGILPATVLEQAFAGPNGHMATAKAGKTQYVLVVTDVTEPDFDIKDQQVQNLKQILDANAGNDLLNQLGDGVRSAIGFTVNNALVQQVVGAGR